MRLDTLASLVEAHDKGTWLDIRDPVRGEPIGLRFLVAGPDSCRQREARSEAADFTARHASRHPRGLVAAATREAAAIRMLAECVIDWEVAEGGEEAPFSRATVQRLLRAGDWLRAQVDAFAASYEPYEHLYGRFTVKTVDGVTEIVNERGGPA